ncbi:MAG: choice-of-anchor tandem repeat GloVer-containing protein [Verrucomicrobiota bacterium]|jgi:uncharacterized repeat protein (TIGR03803 family)
MKPMKRLCAVMVILSLAAGAGAQTFTVLKTFNPNINATGIHSMGTLAQGPDGTLYGVTTDGGAGAAGVVFSVQTNGTAFTVIKSFSLVNVATGTNTDGATPQAGLVLSGGTLFGTTSKGGSGGSGTVFSLSTNGSNFTVLKSFSFLDPVVWTNSDGANPAAALIVSNGVLYGTTENGGTNGQGTVFALQTNGNGFANLYHFRNSSDGSVPAGRLLLSGGTLYGTAQYSDGAGTVFSLSTNGTGFVTLHDFSGSGTDGANPCAGLVLSGGQLFGTTQYGDSGDGSDDGTVFRVDINGNNFTNLYSFTDSVGVGFTPDAELLLSGSTLYGVTGNGGFGFGTVFKINTDGSNFGTVVNLNIIAGWGPDGGLVLSGGVLYGGTGLGGMPGLGNGVVYSVPTDGSSLTALVIFAGPNGAADPDTGLALSGNTLYGTTEGGGTNGTGTLFEIGTNGSGYAEIKDFSITDSSGDNPDGADPRAVLVLSGGTFYGTTRYGGTAGWGTVFKLNADGTGFTNIYSFTDPYPICAWAPLVVSGSTLYGTGSGESFGSVFRINTDGSGFTNFYKFNGTDGNNPSAGWTLSGNVLYGTTMNGGSGHGNIFQLNTDGSHYTNIYSFSGGNDGAGPGSVLVLSNGVLYGTTYNGGTNGQGTVFKINTDRSGFTVLHTFAGTNDGAGATDLLLSGGTLYGTTTGGGSSSQGTVFQMDTAGNNYRVLKAFTGGSDGAGPNRTLVLLGITLYGTTESGGLSGHGTVFSLALSSVVVPIPLNIRGISNAVVLSWTDPASAFLLQASTLVTGVYTNVTGATSPYTNAVTDPMKFFRLQAN